MGPATDIIAASGLLAEDALRRSTVVLTADVVGYSQRMHADDHSTLRALLETRHLIADAVRLHDGRIVSTPGDFVLAEFGSTIASVVCAIAMQVTLANRNKIVPAPLMAEYRVGISAGEVFDIGGDIYGAAINIASRLQAIGDPGSIVVDSVIEAAFKGDDRVGFELLGERRLKNIGRPVTVYRVTAPDLPKPPQNDRKKKTFDATPVPRRRISKPILEIQEFDCLSDHPDARFFTIALREEVLNILADLPNSIDARTAGKEVADVGPENHYILSGNVQYHANMVRIIARLTAATDGATLWAERLDYDLNEEFDMQSHIAREVVAALQLALTEGEQAAIWKRGTTNGRAWELFQRGHDHERRFMREHHHLAKQWYEKALLLDPDYIATIVALGFCHLDEVRLGWSSDEEASLLAAEALYERGKTREPGHPDIFALQAFLRLLRHDHEEATWAMEEAVRRMPLSPEFIGYLGAIYDQVGRLEDAARTYRRALKLSTHASPWISANLGLTCCALGHLDLAHQIYQDLLAHHGDYSRAWIGLTVVTQRLGHHEEAHRCATRVVELDPQFRVQDWARTKPFADSAMLEAFVRDMHLAGLP
ncbi:MAG: adenylate/guanylate cyclase domain-containing protein [Dongiaceae bacterium]